MSAKTNNSKVAELSAVNSTSPGDANTWQSASAYLPALLVAALHQFPSRNPPWIDPIEGSLLMADISGFTALTEKLSQAGKEGAEWLTTIINQYFFHMLDIGRSYGGSNLRFGGDALLLCFQGAFHAPRAVAAALAMQKATQRFKVFRAGESRVRLKMTAGVHSGTFYSAAAGKAGQVVVHLVMGAATNRVAKVQSLATAGELVISSETKELTGSLCDGQVRQDGFIVTRLNAKVPKVPPNYQDLDSGNINQLYAYLPPHQANHLRKHGKVLSIEGEHRKVNIIFINLHGVNEILAKSSPQALMQEIQRYMSTLVSCCEQNQAFILQSDIYADGFKLIVILGAPVAHENDTGSALRLSTQLKDQLATLDLPLYQRVGINNGYVFAGDVGPEFRRQYTVMGDAVNLSARLMSACTPNQILVAKPVIDEAGCNFVVRELPPIKVKGKKDPVAIFALEGERKEIQFSTTQFKGELLGRDNEINLFKKVCTEVETGKTHIVAVSGEPGIGKSRLVQAFRDHLKENGWLIHQGTCQSHTISVPFTPWIGILKSFFSLLKSEPDEARTQKVLDLIRRSKEEFLESAALLNSLLSLSIPQNELINSLDGESRRKRLFEVIAGLLLASTATCKTAIIIEDLHWADHSSLDLLNFVNCYTKTGQLLTCLSYRPMKDRQLILPPDSSSTIALGELTREAAIRLVTNALGSAQLSENVAKVISDKARGNPLFLEEIALAMRHTGNLDKLSLVDTASFSQQSIFLDVPDRLQTLIMSRLDSLEHEAKELIRTAAVIGNSFDLASLQALVKQNPPDNLESPLHKLLDEDLIIPDGGGEIPVFRFRHNLMQEVAYDSLLFARRRQLHGRIAQYLENTHASQLKPFYEILVHHYGNCGESDKTLTYALKSADKARQVFAHDEAIVYYNRALDVLNRIKGDAVRQRSYIMECVGDCYEGAGLHTKAAKMFNSALRSWRNTHHGGRPTPVPTELAEGLPAAVRESNLCRKIGVSYERHSDYDSSLRWLEAALRSLPARHPLQAAAIYTARCFALYRKGDYQESIRWGRLGLAVSRNSHNSRQLAYAHTILATSYRELGALRLALRHRSVALRLYQEIGDIGGQAVAHNNLGTCYQGLGFLDKSLDHYQAALAGFQRVGNQLRIAIAHNNIGEILLIQGRYLESIDALNKVVETYEKLGDPVALTGLSLINLSRVYQRLKKYERAWEHLHKGIELLHQSRNRALLAEAILHQAELELEIGDVLKSQNNWHLAMAEARELGLRRQEARGLRLQARIALAKGHLEEAVVALKRSVALAGRYGWKYEEGLSLLNLAIVYSQPLSRKDTVHQCHRVLGKAIAIFKLLGANRDFAQAQEIDNSLGLSTSRLKE